jgi:hypothetical protein
MRLLLAAVAVLVGAGLASAQPYEGFGAGTVGGAGHPVVRVTTLADSGPGSLRAALARGRRTVVFDVGGEIALRTPLRLRGSFVTLDGSTAPAPGITLRGEGLVLRGGGTHDVIVRDIRVRDSVSDCIQVTRGARNVVLDHVSVSGCGDGSIDVTLTSDVTVSWSLLAEPTSKTQMLIKYRPARITLHHNLLTRGQQRNPQISREGDRPAAETTVDMRNNVVWHWGFGYGTFAMYGPRVNVVDNYYGTPAGNPIDLLQALLVCRGDGVETPESSPLCLTSPRTRAWVHARGNVSGNGVDPNRHGTEAAPFPAPPVTTQDACTAAGLVLAGAGARPRDAVDAAYAAEVVTAGCGG